MNYFHIFLLFAFLFNPALSVKEYLFKTCESAGFCSRNKHFASKVVGNVNYIPKYAIDSSSIELVEEGNFKLTGSILKSLPLGQISLPFEITVIKGNNIRFQVNEERLGHLDDKISDKVVSHHRYNETSKWAFVEDVPYVNKDEVKYTVHKNQIELQYGSNHEYTLEIQFYPIKLTVSYKGQPQVVVNDKNMLNFEHWRSRSDPLENHLHEEESSHDMFLDSFEDSKADKVPLGPESIGLDFTFKNFKHLYGIPEHADSLDLKDTTDSNLPYRLFNVDIFEYETESRMPMYGSIPLLVASKPELSVGLFWINSADTFINIDKTTHDKDSISHWISENGVLDFMIILDKTPADINRNYGLITGYTQLPQLFALGYHQCRWNYNDEKDVLEINSLMDEHQIPYDTIWLDIEYADEKKYFTWQHDKFPSLEKMVQKLDRTGRNLVVIIDPHIKTGYSVSEELLTKKLAINDPLNSSYYGHCWPGESVWIDTTNPSSQSCWDSKFQWGSVFMGGKSANIHLWNDMNEPSVFNGPETTSPRDNLHYGGWEHRSLHNIYGLSFHEATYESLLKRLLGNTNRERPFVLTRSYYAGSQRTAAMWTGDNMSKWEYLRASIPMVLTSNVVGMPFAGADVGGFFGDPSKELLTRWYQTGIWYPFFRAHAHIDSRRREPWVPGDPYTSIIRNALNLRYSFLPVFYTSFYEASKSGLPIIKPLFYDHPTDLASYSIEDEFFVGDSGLLVKPVTNEDAETISFYLPDRKIYYDFSNGDITQPDKEVKSYQVKKPQYIEKDVTLEDIPILLQGGSILARKERYRRSSKLMERDPYTLIIALDEQGNASGKLYVDDGESFNYKHADEFLLVEFSASKEQISGTIKSINFGYAATLDDITIEKITVLSNQEYKVKDVKISQSGRTWAGSYSDSVANKVTIINPKISIGSGWTIDITQPTIDHDEL